MRSRGRWRLTRRPLSLAVGKAGIGAGGGVAGRRTGGPTETMHRYRVRYSGVGGHCICFGESVGVDIGYLVLAFAFAFAFAAAVAPVLAPAPRDRPDSQDR